MSILNILVIILFCLLGAIHIYWAIGGKTGVEKAIPTTVDGKPTMEPGTIITILVGLSLFTIGLIIYLLGFYDLESIIYGKYIVYSGWLLSGVFFIRSIGDFKTIGFFKKVKTTEFAKYDTLIYSPLCIALGVFFAALVYNKA